MYVVDNVVKSLRYFFFNDTATTEIYTLSLHDALPIYGVEEPRSIARPADRDRTDDQGIFEDQRNADHPGEQLSEDEIGRAHVLNSSHANISYAVFCLKKKKIFY